MPITLSFDLPFSLRVDGRFLLNAEGEAFDLDIRTIEKVDATMPGAEKLENVAIVNDETNMLSYTRVEVTYQPSNPAAAADLGAYSREVPRIAVLVSNSLIAALRIAYNEYHIDYLHSADKLGPITFSVPDLIGNKPYQGVSDGLQGGITFAVPPRAGHAATPFSQALARGAALTPASELLFDARRYLMRGNKRMALANLSISFEVGLADKLTEIASSRNDQALEQQIARAALNDLGTGLAVQTLGHSFAKKSYWSDRFADTFNWLRTARNGILHKAQLTLTFEGRTRDFSNEAELTALFGERDWLFGEIEAATARVLAGLPARP